VASHEDAGGSAAPLIQPGSRCDTEGPPKNRPRTSPPARGAYLVRGASSHLLARKGCLTESLEQAGHQGQRLRSYDCRLIAEFADRDYRESAEPIVYDRPFDGAGVRPEPPEFAENARGRDIPVSLVSPSIRRWTARRFRSTSKRCITSPLGSTLGGGDIVGHAGYHGHSASFDLKARRSHAYQPSDKMADLPQAAGPNGHPGLRACPRKAEGETITLRSGPPGITSNCGDSGGAVVIGRAGKTLDKLARITT